MNENFKDSRIPKIDIFVAIQIVKILPNLIPPTERKFWRNIRVPWNLENPEILDILEVQDSRGF